MKCALLALFLVSVCSAIPCDIPEEYVEPLCGNTKKSEILLKKLLSKLCENYARPAVEEEKPCVGGICTDAQVLFPSQSPASPIGKEQAGEMGTTEEIPTEKESTTTQEIFASSEPSVEESSTATQEVLPMESTEVTAVTQAIPTESIEAQTDFGKTQEMFVASTVSSMESSTIPQESISSETENVAPDNDRPEEVRPTTKNEDGEFCAHDDQPCIISEIGNYVVTEAHKIPRPCLIKIIEALPQAPYQGSKELDLLTRFFETVLKGLGGYAKCHKKAS